VLEEIKIKSFERDDRVNIKNFAREINHLDKLELSIPEQLFEYILSQPHLRENIILAYHWLPLRRASRILKKARKRASS